MPHKSDAAVLRTRDNREMMLRSHLWPGQHWLGVKQPTAAGHTFGKLLREPDRDGWTIYAHEGTGPVASYRTLDALLADGWIVD